MADIFISYAREDREHARALAEVLIPVGWKVWWDRKIPAGKIFSQVIEGEIRSARCVLVIWSSHSVVSEWVQNEATEGSRRGILIPVLIDDVQIPFEFRRIQAASLIGWQHEADAPGLNDLLASLSFLLGPPGPQPVTAETPEDKPSLGQRRGAIDYDSGRPAAGEAVRATLRPQQPAAAKEKEHSGGKSIELRKWAVIIVGAVALSILLVALWHGHWTTGENPIIQAPPPTPSRTDTSPQHSQTASTDTTTTSAMGSTLPPDKPVRLDPPNLKSGPAPGAKESKEIALGESNLLSNPMRNCERWFPANKLTLPFSAADNLPAIEFAPTFPGRRLVRVIHGQDRSLLIYGYDVTGVGVLLLSQRRDNRETEYALDFSRYGLPGAKVDSTINEVHQGIVYAQQVDNILYVSHGDSTKARSSWEKNAYVSAIDVSTKRAIWHSAPLVSNASTFEVFDEYLITGYGFTGEPGYLSILRRETGEMVARFAMKGVPEIILRQGTHHVYVCTYDAVLLFEITKNHERQKR